MATEYAVARCRNCGTVRPLIHVFGHYETVCNECGHIYRVREADIKWVAQDRWPLASALLGTRPTAFVTRETPLVQVDLFDQGAPWS